MALVVIQTTPQTRGTNAATVAMTMSTPPQGGNALVIPAIVFTAAGGNLTSTSLTCADNRGNTYARAVVQVSSFNAAVIFVCQNVTAVGPPFTVTLTQTSASPLSYFETCILEIGGIGTSLAIHQTVNTSAVSTTPSPGTTPALTEADVLAVAAMAIGANQTTITVQSVTPVWTEIVENLSFSASIAGEADRRLLSGVSGTTQTCAWTVTASSVWSAVLAVFAPTGVIPPPPAGGGATKGKLGNKHGRTDENGAVIVAVGTTPGTPGVIGPLTVFPHLCGEVTATGLQVTSVTAGALRTPRTPLGNLRVTTDDQGSLRVAPVTAGVIGPLTDLGNLQCRTDETGALIVTSQGAGSLVSAPSPLLNLRGRTDDQGALVVTGLSNPLAYQQRILADGAAAYWPLNDAVGSTSAVDLAGPRHAVISGAVTLGQTGVTATNTSMLFAKTGILTPPSSPVLGLNFTLEAWVNPVSAPATANLMAHSILGTGDWIWRVTSGTAVQFIFQSSSGLLVLTFPVTLTLGAWTYLVMVLTGTVGVLYVNAVASATQPLLTDPATASGSTFQLAHRSDDPGAGWDGRLQDLAIYQTVLSAGNISAHFALRTAT